MKKEVLWLNNPFDLSDVTHYPIGTTMTIKQWLDGHGGLSRLNRMPTVCIYKGRELMRSEYDQPIDCLLYTSPSPRDRTRSRMPSSA